ncbi:ATP-binding cassette sub-family C member 4-like isoform X2 [Brevipalpus obovatus]
MVKKDVKSIRPCPSDDANYFSKFSYWWTFPLFKRGCKKELDHEDLNACSKYDRSELVGGLLRKEWDKELNKGKRRPSLFCAIARAFGCRYIFNALILGGIEGCVTRVAQPLIFGSLLDYFAGEIDRTTAYYYLGLLLAACITFTISHHSYFLTNDRYGMRIRTAVQKLIMEKLFVVSKSALHDRKVGQIINLVSNDTDKLEKATIFFPFLILVPIQATIISFILWKILNLAFLAGFVVLVFFAILQSVMSRFFSQTRRKTAAWTDQRIRLMNEIISGIKVIKMYAWEKSFADMIADIRRAEIRKISIYSFLNATNFALSFVTPRLMLFVSLITFIALGNQLNAKIVFVSSALFDAFEATVTFFLPNAIATLAQALVSCKRITAFLTLTEVSSHDKSGSGSTLISDSESEVKSIEVENLCTSWEPETDELCLKNVSFEVKSGELMIVVGSVGSGKTSLLLSILKEVYVRFEKMKLNGTISYAPQEAWTFNASIRDNILFGRPYDRERYQKVLVASTLDRDMKILPHGDMTLVGERGVALSGGQRARVALARAIYQEADVYLLDDPLAAVDAQVSKQIFKRCCKEYLKNKVVILVTHHLHFLPRADKILVLSQGKAQCFNSSEELEKSGLDVANMIATEEAAATVQAAKSTPAFKRLDSFRSMESLKMDGEDLIPENVPEINEERRKKGAIPARIYWTYFKSGSGVFLVIITLFFNIVSQVLFNSNYLWLADWTNRVSKRAHMIHDGNVSIPFTNSSFPVPGKTSLESEKHNIMIYSALVVGLFISTFLRSTLFFFMCNRASVNLHNSIFARILRSPMTLFESNPVGRILNRFSSDLGTIDEILPYNFLDQIMRFFIAIGIVTIVAIVSWYMLIPAVFLASLIITMRAIYIRTARPVKRMEALAKSPIYSHITSAMDGLTTIRVSKTEDIFRQKFAELQDTHTSLFYTYTSVSRALGIWTDWVCLTYVFSTAMMLMYLSDVILPGTAGLALGQVLMLTGVFQWFVRQSAEIEALMTAVERIVEYTELPTEPEGGDNVPSDWPTRGSIDFEKVYLQYPTAPEPSLSDISLNIEAGEKIGVVGRTGAGKSSLLSCLFRLVEPSGTIKIDGIDITTIALQNLRKKISIIPQDPVIFAGTVRSNLDPFREHTDPELWEVLEDVQLKEKVKESHGELDHEIREGGDNFSVGQRQLICLARALLRNNKILVIDEATANVDLETDQLIQRTIRTKFVNCTVLTIAHRLNTVIDSSRILVLDAGRVVEFDRPYNLLNDQESFFTKLVSKTGEAMSKQLYAIAEKLENKDTQK